MSVTAARLGSSPLTVDWSELIRVPAGTGPSARAYAPDHEEFAQAWERLRARFSSGEIGFYDSPTDEKLSQAQASKDLAAQVLAAGKFRDCLFLGIGGSSLGPACVLSALEHRAPSGIRFHFKDNPDPVDWKVTLSALSPESTLVVAVSKSGTTFETVAQVSAALEWLGRNRWRTHFVVITDPAKGDFRELARAEGLRALDIAPSIGGRFSVFTPVGLFPAALAGLSVDQFMQGAAQVRAYVDKGPLEKNPLFLLAGLFQRHARTRPVHVCMPYSTRLKLLASWWVQLWGESLGKQGKGFTPVAAVGATDQHSILQLLRDGPDDKITWFVSAGEPEDPVKIPAVSSPALPRMPAFQLLQGHSFQELLDTELRATSLVLTKNGRPNLAFRLDRLDERNLGSLLFSLSVLTAVTGTMAEVNPFDQPGVEEGKVYIRESLTGGADQGAARDGHDADENSPVARLRRDRD